MATTFHEGDALFLKKIFNTYATNDFVYVRYPVKDTSVSENFFVQRLIGLPGDSIQLVDKVLIINGFKIADTTSLRNNYFITLKNRVADSLFRLKYSFTEGGQISNAYDYSYSLTKEESEILKNDTLIKKIDLKREKPNNVDETCFPGSLHYPWNMDFYGAIYIPKEHDTLQLDSISIQLYATLIRDYEENKLEVKHDSIFINDQLTNYYVTHLNYYFLLGDNRDNANDSRIWGLLPESHLHGKVLFRIRKQSEVPEHHTN